VGETRLKLDAAAFDSLKGTA